MTRITLRCVASDRVSERWAIDQNCSSLALGWLNVERGLGNRCVGENTCPGPTSRLGPWSNTRSFARCATVEAQGSGRPTPAFAGLSEFFVHSVLLWIRVQKVDHGPLWRFPSNEKIPLRPSHHFPAGKVSPGPMRDDDSLITRSDDTRARDDATRSGAVAVSYTLYQGRAALPPTRASKSDGSRR